MKILITGTAGFTLWNKITDFNAKHYSTGRIGFHLAKRLLERGDTVVGIDNINDYYDVNLKYARLAETGINSIVGFINILEACRHNKNFIN